jgi:hypothetical protein
MWYVLSYLLMMRVKLHRLIQEHLNQLGGQTDGMEIAVNEIDLNPLFNTPPVFHAHQP